VENDAVCCDGLVAGAGLHLSHWEGNETPAELKADTSTEIALRCVAAMGKPERVVVNNHFDADGALSVWALLEPDVATAHADLLIAAAEAGDFDEWPSDPRGLRLEAAIRKLASGASNDARAYELVLAELASLVQNLDARADLWESDWATLQRDDARADSKQLAVTRHGDIVVFHHAPHVDELAGPVLSKRSGDGARGWLLAFEQPDGRFRYRYELPRYAWADTVTRRRLVRPKSGALIAELGDDWNDEAPGMTGLVATVEPVRDKPESVAKRLSTLG
jgi:hypothetical protein